MRSLDSSLSVLHRSPQGLLGLGCSALADPQARKPCTTQDTNPGPFIEKKMEKTSHILVCLDCAPWYGSGDSLSYCTFSRTHAYKFTGIRHSISGDATPYLLRFCQLRFCSGLKANIAAYGKQ